MDSIAYFLLPSVQLSWKKWYHIRFKRYKIVRKFSCCITFFENIWRSDVTTRHLSQADLAVNGSDNKRYAANVLH